MKSLTSIFSDYFYEKVDAFYYEKVLNELNKIEELFNPNTKIYEIDKNDKTILAFIEKFFQMKQNVKIKYNSICEYANSLEGKTRPFTHRVISRNAIKKIERNYPNFKKFISIVNERLNISMEQIHSEIQEEKNHLINNV